MPPDDVQKDMDSGLGPARGACCARFVGFQPLKLREDCSREQEPQMESCLGPKPVSKLPEGQGGRESCRWRGHLKTSSIPALPSRHWHKPLGEDRGTVPVPGPGAQRFPLQPGPGEATGCCSRPSPLSGDANATGSDAAHPHLSPGPALRECLKVMMSSLLIRAPLGHAPVLHINHQRPQDSLIWRG